MLCSYYKMFCYNVLTLILISLHVFVVFPYKPYEDKTKCPKVKALRNFDLDKLMGLWYVVQYYASSEEALSYRCMRAEFSMSPVRMEVALNFSYVFTDDPEKERLLGNITWKIPDTSQPAHWVHEEDTFEEVYNTYVLDSDYETWSLLLHCAEKSRSPRYLSSFIMSRTIRLPPNVISFLRDKLPQYDIDLEYMFPMTQHHCTSPNNNLHYASSKKSSSSSFTSKKHPFKHSHPRSEILN
ncbi:apolipoprotein D-like [Lycorma delicatula]|uniref:apolipoprotein D-like n=1 Tax=Lycorma delicatula TaxID=130591 RepID=UPI003F519BFD